MPRKDWKRRALSAEEALGTRTAWIRVKAVGDAWERVASITAGLTQQFCAPAIDVQTGRPVLCTFEASMGPAPRQAMLDTTESAGQVLARLGYDGAKWAADMAKYFAVDPTPGGWFHSWITNAIEAGITEGESRERKRRAIGEQAPPLEQTLEDLAEEYGTLVVLRKLREVWPESWRAVKAVMPPEPSRPLSADVAEHAERVCLDPTHVPTCTGQYHEPMPADEAQARHDGFTEAIRESGQRIAAAVATELPGTSDAVSRLATVDPVAAGVIGTMAYTSRQQQGEIDRLRREQAQARQANARLINERDATRTQLAQLSDRHQAMAFELAEHKQKLLDVLKAYDDLQTTSGQYKAERDDAQNAVATVNAYANRYQEQRDEARRERDSAQANVATLLDENAQLSVRIEQAQRDLANALNTPRES